MKNATKHAEELRSHYRKLAKRPPKDAIAPLEKQEPLKALVRGAMSFDIADNRAVEAMRLLEREFVDLNELRVATELEVQSLLGVRYPQIEKRVAMFTAALNNIFEREHTLSLDRLATISKRDARQFLRELPEIHPFVEAYVMLYAFEGHSIPIDDDMLQYLKDQEILEESMALEEAQRFLEHHIKADECHEFYSVLRQAAQSAPKSDGKRKKAKV
jgi:endonuclease III